MKTIKALLLVAVFSCSAIIAKANVEPTKSVDELQTQLSEIIKQGNWGSVKEDVKIMVKLTVTSDSQLVVLSTDNKSFDNSVKELLNYKKIEADNSVKNKIFFLPVRLETK